MLQFSIFNLQFSIFNFQSSIFNFQSSIFNFQSSIFNFQSSIFNLQFSIFNFQSSIFNFQFLFGVLLNLKAQVSMRYLGMQLSHVSVRPCAFTVYCLLESWCRMSKAVSLSVSFSLNKERESSAFHTRSLVFIISLLYPLLLNILMSVASESLTQGMT